MYPKISNTIAKVQQLKIDENRKAALLPFVAYIQQRVEAKQTVNINFICTHNSRRSHLAQVWAQVAASVYNISKVTCYSGGTEETALFPKIVETLTSQGFAILKLSENRNPVYAIKYDDNALPIIGFSKKYDNLFNPSSEFAAVMTCSQADEGCPFIAGTEKRIPVPFEDPKVSDNTPLQTATYTECSLEIASQMMYVFSMIKI